MALDVDPAAPGPAGELGVLPWRDVDVGLAVPLDQLLQHDRAGRHVDAQREGLGGEDGFDEALDEQLLHNPLEGRQHPGVVGGDPPLERLEPLPVAQHPQVLPRDVGGHPLDDDAYGVPLDGAVEPQTGPQALLDGGRTTRAAEDEGDGRQQPLAAQPFQHVDAGRHLTAGRAGATLPRDAELLPGPAEQLAVHLAAFVEDREQPGPDHDVLVERDGPVLLHDDLGVTADRDQPLGELLGVAHGRRQRGEPDVVGQVDDHLLPDGAAGPVRQVVDLVHDDVGEPPQGVGPGVEHVAQDLGGHDDDVGVTVDGVVTGQQSDALRAVPRHQVGVLLVGQRLDRGRVKALPAGSKRQVDRELPDHRLAGTRRRCDQHVAAVLEGPAGDPLEGVQPERVTGLERRQLRPGLARPEGGVALGRAGLAPTGHLPARRRHTRTVRGVRGPRRSGQR